MLKVSIVLVTGVILLLIVFYVANIRFTQKVKKEVKEMFNNTITNKQEIVIKADLEGLPTCVKRWLEYSQVVGKEKIKTVCLKQKAVMRLAKEKHWMPTEAQQYFTIEEPGFIWKAKVKMAPFIFFTGRDKYYKGKGSMLIKFLSLLTIVDAKGKEIDQGTLVRYLAETVWFPTAVLCSYITWEEIDSNSAKATMTYKGTTASGIFIFNEKGEVSDFIADRYREVKGKFNMEKWLVSMKNYKEFNDIKIPAKAEVIWKLKEGDFNWYCLKITEVDYNKPFVY